MNMGYTQFYIHLVLVYCLILTHLTVFVVEGVSLSWNITALTKSKNNDEKVILSYATGKVGEGKLHAILGPSGSGKTTLLNVLAGIVPKGSLSLYGEVSRSTEKAPTSVFVQQEDLLFAQLTVQETLETASALKSSSSSSTTRQKSQTLKTTVESFILKLGLKKSTKTPVGDAKTRGISGGEKKRLSIGNELINLQGAPTSADSKASDIIIFTDEPTSGLDSYQALKVVELLRDLAHKEQYTVITSIHQPRASIFELFDEITLMSEGLVIYSGETKNLLSYFKKLGHECPKYINPAEYYLDLISIDYSTPKQEKESRNRVKKLAKAYSSLVKFTQQSTLSDKESTTKRNAALSNHTIGHDGGGIVRRIGRGIGRFFQQFTILFQRAFRQVTRDRPTNFARFMSGLFSALLFGSIYYKMGLGATTVADRLGLLQVAAVNTAMTSLIKATTAFVTEKLIIQRERKGKWYSIEPYFLSKLFAETPLSAIFPCMSGAITYFLCGLNPAPGRLWRFLGILVVESMAATALGMSVGSLASSVDSAVAIAPAVMVIFIVFGGLYVVNTPSYLKWVPQISLIRWAYEALCVNEFTDLKLTPAARIGPLSVSDGKQVLESLGYGKSTVRHAILAQLGIVAANYLFTYISIKAQKPSFQSIIPYPVLFAAKENGDNIDAVEDEDSMTVVASSDSISETQNQSEIENIADDSDNKISNMSNSGTKNQHLSEAINVPVVRGLVI